MKRKLLLSIGLLTFTYGIAQNDTSKEISKEANDVSIESDTYNKFVIELGAGMTKGINPYTTGYYSGNPNKNFGTFDFNSYSLGFRYMFTPGLGAKINGSYDRLKNTNNSGSLPFDTELLRFDVQGVVNGARLLNIQEDLGRFNFLFHGGLAYSRLTSKAEPNPYSYDTDQALGVIYGLMPEFRIGKDFSIFVDLYGISNVRQHYTWDGHNSAPENSLSGSMVNLSFGITYSFGKGDIHSDWAIIESKIKEQFATL